MFKKKNNVENIANLIISKGIDMIRAYDRLINNSCEENLNKFTNKSYEFNKLMCKISNDDKIKLRNRHYLINLGFYIKSQINQIENDDEDKNNNFKMLNKNNIKTLDELAGVDVMNKD